jgi:hypothetical protein
MEVIIKKTGKRTPSVLSSLRIPELNNALFLVFVQTVFDERGTPARIFQDLQI